MCGLNAEMLYVISLEGSDLKVCKGCSSYGKIKTIIEPVVKEKKKKKLEKERFEKPEIELIQMVVSNYSVLVKNARERKGLKQKEIAKLINEKESVIHKIESGNLKPSIKLAEKLERFFRIKLIEQHEEIHASKTKKAEAGEGLTIGDMIKIKKK